MILRKDLEVAVKELERSEPTYQTCAKLADLYTILDHLKSPVSYSETEPKTEFAKVIAGKDVKKVLGVIDELMEATQVLSPKLYENALMRLKEI